MKRQGQTGIWTFVCNSFGKLGQPIIMAMSEWNTMYEFNVAEWEALPIV